MNAWNTTPEDFEAALKEGRTAECETSNLRLTAGYAEVVGGYVFRIAYKDSAEFQVVGASTLGALYEAMERYAPLSGWELSGS